MDLSRLKAPLYFLWTIVLVWYLWIGSDPTPALLVTVTTVLTIATVVVFGVILVFTDSPKDWSMFFMFWAVLACWSCYVARERNWWFPGDPMSPLGERIDNLFYLIMAIVTVVFIGTQIGLGYVLFKGAAQRHALAWYSHGSHKLEVIWTIVPAGVLLFIALYQMDVWAEYRMVSHFPAEVRNHVFAEVTARQFEWRIRYPSPDRKFKSEADVQDWLKGPKKDDLYTVNDLHMPTGKPVLFYLRTQDVQHSFFCPELRVKQDAVPGMAIPVWLEASKPNPYSLTCAELCGWGHYKMKARVMAQPETAFKTYMANLQKEQFEDGFQKSESKDAE